MLPHQLSVLCFIVILNRAYAAMTMKQVEQSLAMFRKSCSEKVGVDIALIEGLHRGEWPDNDKNLKCFSMCVAQSFGTLTKKNDISEAKVRKQIETTLPVNLRAFALGALDACKDVQKNYKDPCDKSYYSTKCMYDFSPKDFLYP
ncbi:general odorant-binding protein lush-like [Sitodiplosis mosellana]|uniref:general odorant-binding protein lush-like n=1 Tax=Sitodiplosis mosellana TaxID=263140 RepID=UPI002443813C|nr:general odorant-binding protein lush-like [Sitodiplosis mosellana]